MIYRKKTFLENEKVWFYILNGELIKIFEKEENGKIGAKKLHLMLGTAVATSQEHRYTSVQIA